MITQISFNLYFYPGYKHTSKYQHIKAAGDVSPGKNGLVSEATKRINKIVSLMIRKELLKKLKNFYIIFAWYQHRPRPGIKNFKKYKNIIVQIGKVQR